MGEFVVKRRFNSVLATGLVATIICFIFALLYWPIWGTAAKAMITALAGTGLALVEPKVAVKYIACFAEGTFFWCIINAWVWQTLIFGNYGKYHLTDRQPGAGLWYTLWSFILGIGAFLILIGFLGIWWKPFSLAILFTPKTAEEVHLAIEGWEAANFYALAVIISQIPFVSLFQKKPFAGNIKAPWDGLGVMTMSTVFTIIVWMGIFIPSFMKFSLGGHSIISAPFGSWPGVLAFAQGFVFWFLIPAEGGELYPMKWFSKSQPVMGFVGLAIALIFGGFLTPRVLGAVVEAFQLSPPGVATGVTVASLELSVIVVMLTWHHLFDDYPSIQVEPRTAPRIIKRLVIWLIGGGIFGVVWLKVYTLLPFAGNNLGMGYPVMGILAGQFAFLMVVLYMNTFFDKWPLVYKEKVQNIAGSIAK